MAEVGQPAAEHPVQVLGADDERRRVLELMAAAAAAVPGPEVSEDPWATMSAGTRHRIAVLDAQRDALLTARDDGAFSSATLTAVLAALDADQLAVEVRGAPV